jgi:hypothetical protein
MRGPSYLYMGFWDIFRPKKIDVKIEGQGFISDGDFDRVDNDFAIKLTFREPVRSDNSVNHLNIRDEEYGDIVAQYNLETGQMSTYMIFEDRPAAHQYGLITINDSDQIVCEQILHIRKYKD